MAKKQSRNINQTVGIEPLAIVEINVRGEYYCYAQITLKMQLAYFNFRCRERLTDLKALQVMPIHYITEVQDKASIQNVGKIVGKLNWSCDVLYSHRGSGLFNSNKVYDEPDMYEFVNGELRPVEEEKKLKDEWSEYYKAPYIDNSTSDSEDEEFFDFHARLDAGEEYVTAKIYDIQYIEGSLFTRGHWDLCFVYNVNGEEYKGYHSFSFQENILSDWDMDLEESYPKDFKVGDCIKIFAAKENPVCYKWEDSEGTVRCSQ